MPQATNTQAQLMLYLEDWQMRMIKDFCGLDCDCWTISITDLKPALRYFGPVASSGTPVTVKRMYFTDWQKREIADELGVDPVPCDYIDLTRIPHRAFVPRTFAEIIWPSLDTPCPKVEVRCTNVIMAQYSVWELTLRCNMRCLHCGSGAGHARPNELSVAECLTVAQDLVDLGCPHVTLIGGEVFLYPGWEVVGRSLSDGGVVVNIVTNGFFMGDRQIAQIREGRLVNVAISLDGMEANHDRTRNVRGSFRRALEAPTACERNRLPRPWLPHCSPTMLMTSNNSTVCSWKRVYQCGRSSLPRRWEICRGTSISGSPPVRFLRSRVSSGRTEIDAEWRSMPAMISAITTPMKCT